MIVVEVPLVTLRVAADRSVHAWSDVARGPQMAVAA
jgi:hypothetical protein